MLTAGIAIMLISSSTGCDRHQYRPAAWKPAPRVVDVEDSSPENTAPAVPRSPIGPVTDWTDPAVLDETGTSKDWRGPVKKLQARGMRGRGSQGPSRGSQLNRRGSQSPARGSALPLRTAIPTQVDSNSRGSSLPQRGTDQNRESSEPKRGFAEPAMSEPVPQSQEETRQRSSGSGSTLPRRGAVIPQPQLPRLWRHPTAPLRVTPAGFQPRPPAVNAPANPLRRSR